MNRLEVIGVPGLPEIARGADLAGLIAEAVAAAGEELRPHDVVVLSQKVVSKAEGRLRPVSAGPTLASWQ